MENMASDRASDEVPFLLDEEKDNFATFKQPMRRSNSIRLLSYSGVLNILLLILLAATWSLKTYDSNKAHIPNEIYCKLLLVPFNCQYSNATTAPAQSAVEYQTVVFSGGLREDKSNFVGSSNEVDARWDGLYNRSLHL